MSALTSSDRRGKEECPTRCDRTGAGSVCSGCRWGQEGIFLIGSLGPMDRVASVQQKIMARG